MESRFSRHDILGPVARQSSVPRMIVDPDTDTILDANDAAENFFEALNPSGTTIPLDSIFDEDDCHRIKEQIEEESVLTTTLRVHTAHDQSQSIRYRVELLTFEDREYLHLSHAPETDPRSPEPESPSDSTRSTSNGSFARNTLQEYSRNGDRELSGEYETLISNVPGVVYRCKYDSDWTMHFISESIEDLTGYPPEEFVRNNVRSYASVVHPEDRKNVQENVRKRVENDEMFELEYRVVDSQDRLRWVLERGQGIRNDDGDVICLEGVIIDITERKLAEKNLRKNEERFRSVFENAEIGMAEISFDERWLSVNNRLEEILGYSEDEFLQMKCREITHPSHIEQDKKCTRKVMEGESDYYVADKRYQHKNGEYVWVRMTVSRMDIPRGDHDGYFIAIIEDINERKRYEQELEKLVDEKETLLKEIHHRVKNNLQMIISLLDMQGRKATTEEAKAFLRESAGRIHSMALLHEMLYQQDQITAIHLDSYVDSLISYIMRAHEDSVPGVEFDLNLDSVELELDKAIPTGLILNELVSNSLEHGNDNGELDQITVDLDVGKKLSLVVRDDGNGFPENFILNDSESLGLKLVESLAEFELNGSLEIHSDNGGVVAVKFPI